MIYDDLRTYLLRAASFETTQLFDSVVDLFDRYGIDDYMNVFDAVIGEESINYDQDTIDSLISSAKEMLIGLSHRFMITFHEDATAQDMVTVLDGVYRFENYELPQTFFQILESDQSSVETFAELIECLTGQAVEKTMTIVADVDQALIKRIKEISNEKEDSTMYEESIIDQRIADYNKVKAAHQNNPSKFDYCLNHIGCVGMPFKNYYKPYLVEHSGDFADPNEIAFAIVAQDFLYMAALSYEGLSKVLDLGREYASQVFPNINDTTKFIAVLSTKMMEVGRVKN